MSPMKHYQGPLLQGEGVTAPDPFKLKINEEVFAPVPDPVPPVDKPEDVDLGLPNEPPSFPIEGRVAIYANNTFGVTLTSGTLTADGHGEHPELAMMLAFTKLWSLLDRPRCAHCGQLLPEEGQTT